MTINNNNKVNSPIKFSNKNVVCKIPCKDCDAYVDQIGRKLSTRISEHRNHINSSKRTNQRS